MKRILCATAATAIALVALTGIGSAASKFKILHAFGKSGDGAGTWGSLTLDQRGDLFGATSGGGLGCDGQGCGTVFELTSGADGRWKERMLYSFKGGSDASGPFGAVVFDLSSNLYSTTIYGGTYGYGTAFELTPQPEGEWAEQVIHSFDLTDGCCPYGGLVIGAGDTLYGVGGVAFELLHEAGGWNEGILHRFDSGAYAGLVTDGSGALYGTTRGGGSHELGTVYELIPAGNGLWKERLLYDFCRSGPPKCSDGAEPGAGRLTIDASGNVYGTTISGGCCGGVVFQLSSQNNGLWREAVLYEFQGGSFGFEPGAGVVRDKSGNLYGTTIYGGSTNCDCGVVYKLAPQKNGKWKYTVLHTFVGSDGAQPDANLILDDKGNLYGTAATGGQYNAGVAFEVTP